MAKVVIIDDDPSVREVVGAYLERDGHTVFAAGDGESGLRLAEKVHPAVVVLDLMLPDSSGIEICRRIRARADTPVVMLTSRSTEDDIVEGLAIGADDYVTKPFSPRELAARVNAALRRARSRTAPLVSIVRTAGGLEIDTVHQRVTLDGEPVELTARQLHLLLVLARFPGRTYSREELLDLADEAAADARGPASATEREQWRDQVRVVDAHVKNLRRRVERDPANPQSIVTVHGLGYRLVPAPAASTDRHVTSRPSDRSSGQV